MRGRAIYRCSKCGTEYGLAEAGHRAFYCCNTYLERVPLEPARFWNKPDRSSSGQSPISNEAPSVQPPRSLSEEPSSFSARERPTLESPPSSTRSLAASHPEDPAARAVVEVIPPRDHRIDAAGVERTFASFANERPVSVEIGADATGVKFLLRGRASVVSRVQHQMQASYDQARFRPLPPEQDPARNDGTPCATAKLRLRRPCYLPLATFEEGDFEAADPLRGLLGVFTHLGEGERLLSQLILTPAPRTWGDRFASYARPMSPSTGEPLSTQVAIRQGLSVFAILAWVTLMLCAMFSFIQSHWLEFLFWGVLAGGVGLGALYLFRLALDRANLNPELVEKKIQSSAYDVSLRLAAFAPTHPRAEELLHDLARAYRQYDLASGNALIARQEVFDPQVLEWEHPSIWDEFTGKVNRLNVAELAALWHLPVDKDVPLIERTQAKRLLPLPRAVREGVLIGHSDHQGHRVPVHLSQEALWGNCFMVAKTQAGKSTLMGHLASAIMREEERRALVVVDPHGDLVRSLLPLVPRERVSDVVFIDFSDTERVLGLNLLDRRQGRNEYQIVSNVVHVGELIWSDFWGPRMEDVLRFAVKTLLQANEKLLRQGEPQFTILDVPSLLQLATFRHRVIADFITDDEVLKWWTSYFEPINPNFQLEIINPVLTKLHRFIEHPVVRQVVGQSSSTVNFKDLLKERKILLLNTATGIIGSDAGGLLGAVVIDFVNYAVREQTAIHDKSQRARVAVIVDEFQTMMGVDYPGLLGELQKYGASFILATQALGQIKAMSPTLFDSLFGNIASLFVFQTSAEDADFLAHEMKSGITEDDIIALADFTCYLRTKKGHEKLPAMFLENLPPERGSQENAELILRDMPRHTYPARLADSDRDRFEKKWCGRELEILKKKYLGGTKDRRDKSPMPPRSGKEDADRDQSPPCNESPGGDVGPKGEKPSPSGKTGEMNSPSESSESRGGEGIDEGDHRKKGWDHGANP